MLGELDRETQAFGLAVPSGIVTHTGVAGLTLGGGIGWIQRKHGLSVDKLLSVDLVTADGEFVTASADQNEDLFWGVRGGGGNFGVVTEFEFECVPLGPQILAGPIFWPMEKSGEVLRFYRDWVADAPEDLMTIVLHRKAPPLPFVPDELHGKHVIMVVCLLGRRHRGGREVRQTTAGVRLPGGGRLLHEAVPDAPGDVRPQLRARPLVLLQELRRRRADRRDHRHHAGAVAADQVAADLVPDLADGRRRQQGCGRRDAVRWPEAGFTYNIGVLHGDLRTASRRSGSGCATSGRRSSPGTSGCT